MKSKKLNFKHLWRQFEDFLFPRLRLTVNDRAVYSHLFRHSRLEGKRQLRFSMTWLARGIGITTGPVRDAVRRLVILGVLRLLQRSKNGHFVEVRLPDEIRAPDLSPEAVAVGDPIVLTLAGDLEELDFLTTRALRKSIHFRERGHCFYCLKKTDARGQCLDHVVPRVKAGGNSYRNLVSCCMECNSQKGEHPASDLLRWLYRERRLTSAELNDRLHALDALTAGKLLPPLRTPGKAMARKGRPRRALTL